ncbi:MAG: N-acetylmuramoyl-L-alanine amidase, partial [Pseudomonadota bacterium]
KYKAKLINQINPVAAIENHLNASDNPSASYGAEVIHYQGSTKGEKLAKNLSNRFSYLPVKQKGTTGRNDLYLLKSTRCPAVITEPFFFSHQVEQKLLEFNRGVDVVGKLIAEGINSWVTMI